MRSAVLRSASVCSGLFRSTGDYRCLQGSPELCKGPIMPAEAFWGLLRSAKVCKGLQQCEEVFLAL